MISIWTKLKFCCLGKGKTVSNVTLVNTPFIAADTITTGQVWIGGTDLIQEAVFVEPKTLEPLKYFNWAPGEPDNLGGQHCLGLFKDNNWLWDDNGCEVENFPLCKRT